MRATVAMKTKVSLLKAITMTFLSNKENHSILSRLFKGLPKVKKNHLLIAKITY